MPGPDFHPLALGMPLQDYLAYVKRRKGENSMTVNESKEVLNLIAEIWCKDIAADIRRCGAEIDALKNRIAGLQRAQDIIEACAREGRPMLKQANDKEKAVAAEGRRLHGMSDGAGAPSSFAEHSDHGAEAARLQFREE